MDDFQAFILRIVEGIIRRLAPREHAWTLGEAGTTPMAEHLAALGRSVSEDEANP